VNLVNKDQLEILATLRESVNEDKVGLEAETGRLEKQIKELAEKNRMQLEQINGLLMEKVNLQTEGIGQREKMLQRERDIGYAPMRCWQSLETKPVTGICGGSWQAGICRRISRHVSSANTRRPCNCRHRSKTSTTNCSRRSRYALPHSRRPPHQSHACGQFIKQQDKLFKEEFGSKSGEPVAVTVLKYLASNRTCSNTSLQGAFDEAETSYKSQLVALRETLTREKVCSPLHALETGLTFDSAPTSRRSTAIAESRRSCSAISTSAVWPIFARILAVRRRGREGNQQVG
jgi:hypothetical protein